MPAIVSTVYVGRPKPIGSDGKLSSMAKQSIEPPWHLSATGFQGDQQADLVRHGGIEKAVHQYPREHYLAWIRDIPELANRFSIPPAFGENLSIIGMNEDCVCIGDIYKLGSTLLQVSQGRQPCWKLNEWFRLPDMARKVQDTGRTGWYFRVLEPGTVYPDDMFQLVEQRHEEWPIKRLAKVIFGRSLNQKELMEMADISSLADSWRKLARNRLEQNTIEDWSARLNGT